MDGLPSPNDEQARSIEELSKADNIPSSGEIEQILKNIPPDQREKVRAVILRISHTTSQFSGPLPPPQILKEYEAVLPGSADRIISMAEHQAIHRQTMESAVVSANILNEARGLNYGFVLALILLVGGLGAILIGRETTGLITLGTGVGTLAVIYINAQNRSRKELKQKQNQAQNPSLLPAKPKSTPLVTPKDDRH